MATLFALEAFDQAGLDMHVLVTHQTGFSFLDGTGLTWNGATYADVVMFEYDDGGPRQAWFGGDGVVLDAGQSQAVAGTARGFVDLARSGTLWLPAWGVQGFAVPATAVSQAIVSPDTADDAALLATILAGADLLTLSSGADVALGWAGDDVLRGGAGNDSLGGGAGGDLLDGGSGADTLTGGSGNDLYLVDQVGDRVCEATVYGGTQDAGGVDTVRSPVHWSLAGDAGQTFVERLVLTGTRALRGTGNGQPNRIEGNAGANVLDGGPGADTLVGGAGDDTYVVDDPGDRVLETASAPGAADPGGVDMVRAAISFSLAASQATVRVENLHLAAPGPVNGTGNDLDNVILAGAGDNRIDGRGGTGDLVSYVSAGSAVSLDLRVTAVPQSTGGSGSDRIWNVEGLAGSRYADRLAGNALANMLQGGAGADSLSGGGGRDTLHGGPGNDSLVGGPGADQFWLDGPLGTARVGNRDRIGDFLPADDTFCLPREVFTAPSAGVLPAGAFVSANRPVAREPDDHILHDRDHGVVSYDADGDGPLAAVPIALVGANLVLTAADFLVA